MKIARFIYTILLTLLAYMPTSAKVSDIAQDSIAKSKIAQWWKVIESDKFGDRTVSLCDSVIVVGEKYGLYQDVANAMSEKMHYHSQRLDKEKDEELILKEFKLLKEYSIRHHFKTGVSKALGHRTFFYLNRAMYDKAMSSCKELMEYSTRHNLEDDIVTANRYFAGIYYMQGRLSLAAKCFVDAGDAGVKNRSEVQAYNNYSMASVCFFDMKQYDKALEYNKKSYDNILAYPMSEDKYKLMKYSSWIDYAQCYYYLHDEENLQIMVDSIMSNPKLFFDKSMENSYYSILALVAAREGELEKAIGYTDSLTYTNTRDNTLEEIYLNCGDWEKAAAARESYLKINLDIVDKSIGSFATLQSNAIELRQIELSQKKLQQSKKRILLETMLANESRNSALIQKTDLERNDEIVRVSTQMQIAQQKKTMSLMEQERIEDRMMQTSKLNNARKMEIRLLAFIVFIIFVGMCALALSRRGYLKKLKKEDEEIIKAKKEAENHLKEAEKLLDEAKEANDIKTQFIESISREVRIPLNAIVGFSSLLTDQNIQASEQEKQSFTQLIEKNSTLLSSLVNDILDLANLTSGKYKMQYEEIPVATLMDTFVYYAKSNIPKSVELETIIPKECEDLSIETDNSRTFQAVNNLISNACKFTQRGKIIVECGLSIAEDSLQYIIFSVIDTGVGVPKEKSEIIFNRFYKDDEFSVGNGLGLTICRTIAMRLSGECYLDTSWNSIGSRFCFKIPVHKPEKTVDVITSKIE